MGKCLSCFRVDPVSGPKSNNQIAGFNGTQNHHHIPFQISGYQERDRSAIGDASGSENSKIEIRVPLQPLDNQSNGSNINSNIVINMPEKRTFYNRIPPLAKSASNEMRRVSSRECSDSKINAMLEHYKDAHCDCILSEGIIKFCADLDVKPDDFRVLVLAWKFGAETMCKFTREEFFTGCKALKADSVKGIQSKFPDMVIEVQNAEKFKDFYRFTYKFGLDAESGQRILPTDMAIQLWKLVFSQREPAILSRWINFLEKHPSIRGLPRDTWNMFLNFVDTIGDDLSVYDDTEAWPSLLDDFVEYENDQLNQNVKKEDKEKI